MLICGTDAGEIVIIELLTCTLFRTHRLVERAGGGKSSALVSAVAVHPSMTDPDGGGDDIIYVGLSDGTVRSVRLLSGERLHEFAPPEVEYLTPSKYVSVPMSCLDHGRSAHVHAMSLTWLCVTSQAGIRFRWLSTERNRVVDTDALRPARAPVRCPREWQLEHVRCEHGAVDLPLPRACQH
jgi:hypothetical protein